MDLPVEAGTADGASVEQTTTAARRPARRLDSLTGLRFIAAAMVVVHHTVANDVNAGHLVTLAAIRPIATLGFTGVTFFFILSGFVLAWSARSSGSKRDFWSRRFARVYPLHLLTWILAIPVLLYADKGIGAGTAVLCLVLLQAWSPKSSVTFGMNALSWSLSCEAFFYAAFPWLFTLIRRLSLRQLAKAVAGCIAVLVLAPAIAFGVGGRGAVAIFYYFPAYRVFEFIIGICLAVAIKQGWRPRLPGWFGPGAVVISVAVAVAASDVYKRAGGGDALPRAASTLIMLPAFIIVIVAAACRDLDGKRSVFSSAWLVRLGVWSFALYMTHHLVLVAVEAKLGGSRPETLAANVGVEVLALVVAVLISGIAYRLVELPLERILRLRMTTHH